MENTITTTSSSGALGYANSTMDSVNGTKSVASASTCHIRNAAGHAMVNMTIPFTTFSICVVGNLFAIVFLWKSNQRSDKKQHIFYTLVMTLAWCDFVSVIVTSPITFVAYMSGRCVMELGGMSLCRYSGFAMMFFGIGSVAIVFAMSLERFIAIRFTMFYQRSMTTHKTRVFLLIIIISLLALSSLPLLGFGDVKQQFPGSWCFLDWKSKDIKHQGFNFLVAFLGIALMLGTIICNFIVVITVLSSRRRMRNKNSTHGLLSKESKKRNSQQEAQMIVLLGLMTVVFVVCYLPILLRIIVNQVATIYSSEGSSSHLSTWDLFAVRMATINPIIDPWKEEFQEICLSSREFRRRKSARRHMSSTFSSINGQQRAPFSGYRKASRSPHEGLCAIKEGSQEENVSEVNGNHIQNNGKTFVPEPECEVSVSNTPTDEISSS